MQEFLPILQASRLFSGVAAQELEPMLVCLAVKPMQFSKGSFLLHAGEKTDSIGLVLSGSVLMLQEDIWGNRNILSKAGPGQTFALAFACAPDAALNLSVAAETPVAALFLNVRRVLTLCPAVCSHHSLLLRNLLGELAEKNLALGGKLTHMGQRSTRAKLLSYLSSEAQRQGRCEFEIPFTRQQLADYLGVERSGLSAELGKMQREGLLDFHKSRFVLRAAHTSCGTETQIPRP